MYLILSNVYVLKIREKKKEKNEVRKKGRTKATVSVFSMLLEFIWRLKESKI